MLASEEGLKQKLRLSMEIYQNRSLNDKIVSQEVLHLGIQIGKRQLVESDER